MAETTSLKPEKDFSAVVDVALPEAESLAKSGRLTEAIEHLLGSEKQTRVGADLASNTRILVAIVNLCAEAKDWKLLNENVVLLSKKHGLLKQAVTRMVQEAMTYIDKTPDMKTKLELIDTLRTVTEGKIFVEVERARVTRLLSKIREDEGKVVEAADILQELAVETFGSMDKREKTDFILEQMRLCLAKKDYVRMQIISRKISTKFFADEANHDLKLRYYELMIQHAVHEGQYLNACKYYRQIYDTPSILKDDTKWSEVLKNVIFFIALSPYDNEQSDLIHRIFEDPNLNKVLLVKEFGRCFVTNELVRWPKIEEVYGAGLRESYVFNPATEDGEKRWKELHKRVIEHNIRVIAKYYDRITVKRLTQLLDLPPAEAESFLSNLVVKKTIYAKIDRPAGVVTFVPRKDPNTVLNEWSTSINSLLELIAKTTHLITKEEMVHSITKVI
ncbi:26S proteasome non-ATPase regulatory subunit 12 [Borealophlyctis nickersoniae]|nr:26S proteasome non-ATPase regulatory subunit 12 [Borealophlyctis nickersoniae]